MDRQVLGKLTAVTAARPEPLFFLSVSHCPGLSKTGETA